MSDTGDIKREGNSAVQEDTVAGFPRDVVVRALEENLWSGWSNFGRGADSNLYDEGGALWFDTPIPTPPYNTVLRFKVPDNPDERLDALFQHYERRGVPMLWIHHPSSEPADLGERLTERGLEEVEIAPGMAANLAELPDPRPAPDGIEVREVTEKDDVERLFELIVWRWNIPPEHAHHYKAVVEPFQVGKPSAKLRVWMAWRNGVPLAKAALHIGGGAAGLHGVATKPEARGLGLATILTLKVFKAAREEGQQLGVLHSSPMAESLYAKLGFRKVAPFKLFASGTFHV